MARGWRGILLTGSSLEWSKIVAKHYTHDSILPERHLKDLKIFCHYRERASNRQFPNFAFVDAGNLSAEFNESLRRFGYQDHELGNFDFTELFAVDSRWHRRSHDRIYVYHAPDTTKENPKWLTDMESRPGYVIRLGKLTKKSGTVKQQGVDVLLAIEAIQLSYAKAMSSCHLYSFDGDFLPLIDALVNNGTIVTVCAFSNPGKGEVGPEFQRKADSFERLGKVDLQRCLKNITFGHPNGWKSVKNLETHTIKHPTTGQDITYYVRNEADDEGTLICSGVNVASHTNIFTKFKSIEDFKFWLRVRPDGLCVDLNSNAIMIQE